MRHLEQPSNSFSSRSRALLEFVSRGVPHFGQPSTTRHQGNWRLQGRQSGIELETRGRLHSMHRGRAMASNRIENRFIANVARGDASSFGSECCDAN
jgi:hypothetical protein